MLAPSAVAQANEAGWSRAIVAHAPVECERTVGSERMEVHSQPEVVPQCAA
jgi:hypothetical protein